MIEPKYKVGQVVKVDYSQDEILQKFKNNTGKARKKKELRSNRIGIVIKLVEKQQMSDGWNMEYDTIYRYKVLVGRELVEIGDKCLL